MNTPAHLAFGLAAFGRPGAPAVTAAALIGALLPDLSLYLLAGWELAVMGTPARTVFGEMYFSDAWQAIFAVDNSFFVWGAVTGLGLALRRPWIVALGGAALLHLLFDITLHNDDARRHFWPLSDWRFVSPVSYWDRNHHGQIAGTLEIAAVAACTVYVWRRFREIWVRVAALALMAAEIAPVFVWAFVFAT